MPTKNRQFAKPKINIEFVVERAVGDSSKDDETLFYPSL